MSEPNLNQLAAVPRIVMMGTGTFAEPVLEALIEQRYPVVGLITQPDRNVGVVRGSTHRSAGA